MTFSPTRGPEAPPPLWCGAVRRAWTACRCSRWRTAPHHSGGGASDRKSTRLNSSHGYISYAVFCLKKKKIQLLPLTHICTINTTTSYTIHIISSYILTQITASNHLQSYASRKRTSHD